VLLLLLTVKPAYAKQGEFALSLSVGSGYILGYTSSSSAQSDTISKRNPMLIDFDFQYEVLSWLAPSLRLELTVEGGEALTVVPGVVFDSDGDHFTFFGRVGIAIRLEPNYYGIDLGAGFIWHFLEHLGLVCELNVEPLFISEGLKGGVIVPILGLVGFRGNI